MTDERPKCPFPVPLDVCHLFEELTLTLWESGWDHYSARAIMHQIRWHNHVALGNRSFKCNNNWTPALARWVMQCHQYIGDFFHTRTSPRQGGAGHNLEDYMGPFT